MRRSACRRVLGEVQVVAAVLKQWLVRKGRYRAIGEYMTALLLCQTATTGKRGGRQGEATTWVESLSVNVGCGSCWGLGAGVWRASDLKTETEREREAESSSGGVNRGGGGESRLVVQRDNTPSPRTLIISEMCRYVRLRLHPHSCPPIETTRSSQSGRPGSDSDSQATLVWRLSPDKRCWSLPILSVAMCAMQLRVFL